MKTIITITFVFLFSFTLFGQNTELEKSDLAFFSKNNNKILYTKYPKSLIQNFENYILINNSIKIRFPKNLEQEYRQIIESGFLSPEITNNVNDSEYCCFMELKTISPNIKTKRFKFWIFYPKSNNPLTNRINPDEYYFELQNEKGDEEMDFETFIKGATLTFIRFKTIII